jgi:hypothetical protein
MPSTFCTDELRAVKLLPDRTEAIRIERFIEKRFGVTPEYADLPEGILGMMQFPARGMASRAADGTQGKTPARGSGPGRMGRTRQVWPRQGAKNHDARDALPR